jgi:carbamoyl-phosphate synthase large subunit
LDFGSAYAKAQLGAGQNLPTAGTVFISVIDNDKKTVLPLAAKYCEAGFNIMATHGTSRFLADKPSTKFPPAGPMWLMPSKMPISSW